MITDYRLSGATTEVNSECYAALLTVSHMARVLGKHADSARFKAEAEALRDAINEHLFDPASGLYYLNIEFDGTPRTDVTSDLVFPGDVRRGRRRGCCGHYRALERTRVLE